MKKKTFILVFICILLLTGCKGRYYAVIDKDYVKETITVKASNNSEYNKVKNWSGLPLEKYISDYEESYFGDTKKTKRGGVEYYNTKFDDNTLSLIATANYAVTSHKESSLARNMFAYYDVLKESDRTIFSTSKGLIYDYGNFDIVINTPYKVLTNNAASVNKNTNTYTWHVTTNNFSKIGVYLEIDFSQKFNEEKTNNDPVGQDDVNNVTNDSKTIIYVLVSVVIFFVLGGAYLIIKRKGTEKV